MKVVIPKGSTSRILTVFIQDSSSTTGAGLGSLTQASSITGGYVREGGTGVALAVDEDVTTEGTYQAPSTAAHVRIGTPANMISGIYELHFHNDLWATGAETVTIGLSGASNMAPLTIEVQLSDPVRGLGAPTALPNAAAEASGGLATLSAAQASNGTIQANVHRWLTATPNALQSGRVDSYLGAVASGVIAAASFAAGALDAVWSTATRVLTAGTNIVLAKGSGVTGFNDLSAAEVNAEVDTALADYDGPTYTELLNLFRLAMRKDAAIATDLASLLTAINADLASGGGAFDNTTEALEAIRDRGDAAWITATVPSAADNADAVWDEALAGHLGVGSTGTALNAAGSAGDPWSTAIPAAYGVGTAGKIVGDNLNAAVASRSSHSAADVWAVGTRTLTSFGTLVSDVATAVWAAATRTLTAFAFTPSLDAAYDAAKTAAQAGDAMALTGSERTTLVAAVWAAATRTLTSFGTLAADVWASATRTLTAFGFTPSLDAAYDPAKTAAQAGDAMALTSAERNAIAAALLDLVNAIETGITPREALRLILASASGETDGAGTASFTLKSLDGAKTRATVATDGSGNRTNVTLGDLS